LLNCAHSKTAIGESIAKWNAQELEDTLAEYGLSGGMLRTEDEWRVHPQGKSLTNLPVVDIVKIGKSESELNINDKKRPLSGIRVIDLTRVLAGPMASRLLAEQGADVMHISSPNLPYLLSALLETGMGKKSAFIDLDKPKDVESIKGLISKSDIFCENYHRSGLSKHGLSPLELAKLRPGIIYVSESTYGEAGPWQYRRGAEQLAESVTGMSAELGAIDSPKTFPGYLNDYVTGYLAAFGACAALIRRAKEGGSYWVRVSLCRSAMWVQDLGRVSSSDIINPLTCKERESFMIESDSPFGKLKHVGPVAKYSETPSYYDIPVVPLGAHQPIW
jgi:crotonobetainyl-CoA:carnitine CoA-transferase CaiB-like acyl-CoA transferase